MPSIQLIRSRWAAALALAAVLFVAGTVVARPSAAKAQSNDYGSYGGDWCEVTCVVVGVAIIALPTTMLIAEAMYAANARWFPPGWAVAELVLGLPMLALGVAGLSQGESPEFGIVFGGLGLWFTTHAIISLIAGERGSGGDRAHARLARWLGPVRFDL